MASIQKSVDAYKTIHHDYQQLANVNRVLTDCTESLNTTQKSRKEIAKSTKLCLEVLEIVGENTQAGLKTLAPSHSFGAAMKSNEAEKRRELAEETGTAMIEKDPVKNLREFLKRKKVPLVQSMLPPPSSAPVLKKLADLSDKSRPRMTSVRTPQTMGSYSCLLSCTIYLVHWMLRRDHLW
jgi:hypothetical protein